MDKDTARRRRKVISIREWQREKLIADLQREFPGWQCWRGISGRYYARRPTMPRGHKADTEGEDLADLRDSIIRLTWKDETEPPG